jgi:hypothetical protein
MRRFVDSSSQSGVERCRFRASRGFSMTTHASSPAPPADKRAGDRTPNQAEPKEKAVRLWPYGVVVALAMVLVLLLVGAGLLWITNRWAGWPTAKTSGALLYFVVGVSLVPVILLVLESVRQRGGSVTTKWGGIDWGREVATAARPTVEIPKGLGFEGQPIYDINVVSAHQTITAATSNDIVRIDLGTGESWWTTRLFTLSFAAARNGAPKVLVFVGRFSGVDYAFLGWARPSDVFRLLRGRRDDLRLAFDRAEAIARYVTSVAPWVSSPPQVPPPHAPPVEPRLASLYSASPQNFVNDPRFQGAGEETDVRILIDLLGQYEQAQSPQGGERVTPAVLQDVLGPELRQARIDVGWSRERQLSEFLGMTEDYVAIVDGSRFERFVQRRALENAVLRRLVAPQEAAS